MHANKKAAPVAPGTASNADCATRGSDRNPPVLRGQCAQVVELIKQCQPFLSSHLTADHAIPEAAARGHDLRSMGFNIITTMVPEVAFRGRTRKNVALYSLGSPQWRPPKLSKGERL